MGRCFGVSVREDEPENIFMFEIGTGEVFGISKGSVLQGIKPEIKVGT